MFMNMIGDLGNQAISLTNDVEVSSWWRNMASPNPVTSVICLLSPGLVCKKRAQRNMWHMYYMIHLMKTSCTKFYPDANGT